MVNIGHAQSIRNIFRVVGHFADGCYILRLQTIGNTHFIEIGITRKRENSRILVLPAKLAHAILSGRLEDRDFNCLALNRSIGLSSLTGGNRKERLVGYGLYKTVSQRVEHGAQGSNIFCVGYMLLGLRTYGTVVDNGTAFYGVRSAVNRDRRIDKVAVHVIVTDSLFRKLAGRARHPVVMAFDARRRVENRTQAGTWIMSSFKLGLIEREGVAGRLCYPVAGALRTCIYR